MSRLVRLILAIALVESMLAGLWWYMLQPDPMTGRTNFIDPAAGPAEVSQMMGTAMGVVLGAAIFLFIVASAADRRKAAIARRP